MANLTSEDFWAGIQAIGGEDDSADELSPAVIAKLIELRFVTLSATGISWLTEKGERLYVASESGDGEVHELAVWTKIWHSTRSKSDNLFLVGI
jgi:hypothetical protein